jgi:hypothetical protein
MPIHIAVTCCHLPHPSVDISSGKAVYTERFIVQKPLSAPLCQV